jgi:hypothetical protein
MNQVDSAPILERLLAVTLASRDAFAHAACAIRTPGFAALFVERTEDQTRIAAYLNEQLALGVLPAIPTCVTPNGGSNGASGLASSPEAHDSYTLLGECIRVLDIAILEFSRAYGPAISLAQRIQLARHQHQMGWAREELFHLRCECRTPRFPRADQDVAEQPYVLDTPRFGASRYANRQDASLSNGMPHDGVVSERTGTGR